MQCMQERLLGFAFRQPRGRQGFVFLKRERERERIVCRLSPVEFSRERAAWRLPREGWPHSLYDLLYVSLARDEQCYRNCRYECKEGD